MEKLQSFRIAFVALMACLACAVIAFGSDTVTLGLAVEWVQGFTAHADGATIGAVMATVGASGTVIEKGAPPADGAQPDARTVIQMDPEQLARMVADVVDVRFNAATGNTTGELKPDNGGINPHGDGQRADADPAAEFQGVIPHNMKHLSRREIKDLADSYRMLVTFKAQDYGKAREVQKRMITRGSYGPKPEGLDVNERSVHNTLTDADGGVFLPTAVAQTVLQYATKAGVIPTLATRWDIDGGTLNVPNTASTYTAYAVVEGSVIKSRKLTFAKVSLLPKKWGVIAGWTSELGDLAAAQFMMTVAKKVGQAFQLAADDAGFNGDGGASYNGITGLASAAGTGTYTMAATKTAFTDFSADDAIDATVQTAVGARENLTYVFHPDMESVLRKMKDGNGAYVYAYDKDGRGTLAGKPVRYTEALPALSASAISTVFGWVGDFSMIQFGVGQELNAKLLDQATIIDTDDSTEIHLGASDSEAMRYTQRFDIDVALAAGFAKIRTAAA